MNKDNKKLLDRYLMICKNKGLTNETTKAKKLELSLFLNFIGNMDLKDVTHTLCDDFLMYCQSERKNGDWALSRKHSTLTAFFDTLIKKEYLTAFTNPMYKVDKVVVRKRIKDYLTVEEIDKIKKYLESINDKRGLAYWMLTYSSACRISEIHQLNRNSLDFHNRKFSVIGKGDKQRMCFFSEEARDKILDYLNSRDDGFEPLFLSTQKKRWSKKAIQDFVSNTIKRVGINKHITPHSLRHSILTNLRLDGALLEDLQLLAGHASISTTQAVYTHVGLDDVKDKFDEFHRAH